MPTNELDAAEADLRSTIDNPATVEQPAEQTTEERVYAGKFKSPDELEKSYLELEKFAGSRGNELGSLRKELESIRSAMQPKEKVEEETTDKWLERFVTDPKAALKDIIKAEKENILADVKPLKEYVESRRITDAVDEAFKKFPDMGEYADDVLKAITAMNEDRSGAFEKFGPYDKVVLAYNIAKAGKVDDIVAKKVEEASKGEKGKMAFVEKGSEAAGGKEKTLEDMENDLYKAFGA